MSKSFCGFLCGLLLLVGLGSAVSASTSGGGRRADPRLELGVLGGVTLSRALGTTNYQDTWSSLFFTSVKEATAIDASAKRGYSVGGYLSFYVVTNFGFQLFAESGRADGTTAASISFGYTPVGGAAVQKSQSQAGTGRLTRTPLSLNLAARLGGGPLELGISGGVTYFHNTLSASSVFGYGVTRLTTVYAPPNQVVGQNIDALPVPLRISGQPWNTVGANVGAALSVRLGHVGLVADGRYYLCPKKLVHWTPLAGTYDGLYGSIKAEPFSVDDVSYLTQKGQTFGLSLDLSYFRVSGGLAFFF